MRTALDTNGEKQSFTVTHPFHPWRGRQFELVDCQRRWGQWRVYYLSDGVNTAFMPASWTDLGPKDPFMEQSQGRAMARVDDLLELVKMAEASVKEIKPKV